jgi:hypothetical protein
VEKAFLTREGGPNPPRDVGGVFKFCVVVVANAGWLVLMYATWISMRLCA